MSNLTKTLKCLLPTFSIEGQKEYLLTSFLIVGPLHMIFVIISFILNSLILLAVYKKRRLRRSSTFLLCSINAKDLILISILQPIAVYRSFAFNLQGNVCAKTPVDTTRAFLIFLYRSVTLSTMVLISVDRWIAIWRPSAYRGVFTSKRIAVAITLVWLVSIVISFVATYVIEPKHRYQLVFVQFGITALLVSIIQIGVYAGIKRHGRKITDMSTSQKRQITIERSIACIVLYVIIALAICYIPLLVVSAIRFLENINYFPLTSPWMELVLYVNAMANPIIWMKTNPSVKKAVADVVVSCFNSSTSSTESMDMTGSHSRGVASAVTNDAVPSNVH